MDFNGKRVLVTGSTRGIGLATARRFRDLGARVAVNGRAPQAVEAAVAQLGRRGLTAAPGDLASAAGCRAVVAAAIDGLGGLDVLVNNAGLFRSGPAESFDEAEFDRMMAVNVKAVYFCIVAALPTLPMPQLWRLWDEHFPRRPQRVNIRLQQGNFDIVNRLRCQRGNAWDDNVLGQGKHNKLPSPR